VLRGPKHFNQNLTFAMFSYFFLLFDLAFEPMLSPVTAAEETDE
jgi:hypothetical protein